MPVTAQPRSRRAPARRAARGVSEHDGLRGAVAVVGRPRGGQQPVDVDQRRQPLGLGDSIIRLGTPSSFCRATFCSNASTWSGLVEQEQVADLVQVDLLAEVLLEVSRRSSGSAGRARCSPRRRTARALRRRPCRSNRSRGRPARAGHVADAGRGQVVGRAEPDHAAADDDDRSVRRKIRRCHHPPRFHRGCLGD